MTPPGAGLTTLVEIASSLSSCSVPASCGSKAVIGAPMPSVELTRPLVPLPAPLAATVVPPVPDPTVPPSPPTPPPGVFCTTPALMPRMLARDVDIQIVLECQRDSIVDGEINLAVAQERIDPRRVRHPRLRQILILIREQRVREHRARDGIVPHVQAVRRGLRRRRRR